MLGLVYLLGTREYLGLGVWSPNPDDATILGFFRPNHVDYWSWAWKALFTIVTLNAGFKGGEVTPLFFIGAGLGSALAGVLGAPVDLFAALGFVAVFAGATNTPLACMIMADRALRRHPFGLPRCRLLRCLSVQWPFQHLPVAARRRSENRCRQRYSSRHLGSPHA